MVSRGEGNHDTTYLVLSPHSCNELRSLDDKNHVYFSIRLLSFFFFFKVFLLYWIIADYQCCEFSGEQEVPQLYINMYPFSAHALHPGCHTTLSRAPCAIQ